MNRTTLISAVVLAAVLAGIVLALFLETSRGPTFTAADYESYEECLRNIPSEWAPGSLQRSGAEESCFFVHRRGR